MDRRWRPLLLGLAVTLGLAVLAPRPVRADGTFYLVELQTGMSEAAYDRGDLGLSFGVTAGVTFKLKVLPVRWYLLGNLTSRSSFVEGSAGTAGFSAERRDLDLYAAQRFVLPVYRQIRVFAEGGIGQRYVQEYVTRSDLGTQRRGAHQLLVVLAGGVQARVNETFSLGLRGELMPLASDAVLTQTLTGLSPTTNRMSVMAQVGVHF
ncbi:MAG: hypothetical protein RMA76_42180 [Deltaproteobacteria bacterium]|jgi:hypothetical protein